MIRKQNKRPLAWLTLILWIGLSNPLWIYGAQQPSAQDSAKQLAEAAELTNTVVKLFREQKFDEALPLAKRALEIRQRFLNADNELIGGSLVNLGELYFAKKKFGDARSNFEHALKVYESSYGPEDQRIAPLLNRLASVYFELVQDQDAEHSLKRAIEIKEKTLGAESLAVADSLDNLGQVYRFHGDAKKAETAFDRALKIMQTKGPRDSPATTKLLKHYQCMLYETDQESKIKGLNSKYLPVAEANNSGLHSPGSVINGRAIRLVQPAYPEAARALRASGIVVVLVRIDEGGHVIRAEDFCDANPVLAKPAIEAARASEFSPTTLSSKPVQVNGLIIYRFVAR